MRSSKTGQQEKNYEKRFFVRSSVQFILILCIFGWFGLTHLWPKNCTGLTRDFTCVGDIYFLGENLNLHKMK